MTMDHILEVKKLRKEYGSLVAVDDLDLSIPHGQCFGLLGPNGAGKTTTIEMMEGIIKPSGGQILFKGEPIGPHFRERVGIQFQHTALQEFITVEETLKLFGSLYPYKRPMEEVIELCSLGDYLKQDNRKLSGGQRQRMLLALAIIPDPELIFLDEPTTGLDPQARRNFWALIEKIKGERKTILLTTHYMDEAETLCDTIAIMDHGRIIAQDSPQQLLDSHFEGAIIRIPQIHDQRKRVVEHFPGAQINGGRVEIPSRQPGEAIQTLAAHGLNLEGLSIASPNLDDLFLKLTGTSLRA